VLPIWGAGTYVLFRMRYLRFHEPY